MIRDCQLREKVYWRRKNWKVRGSFMTSKNGCRFVTMWQNRHRHTDLTNIEKQKQVYVACNFVTNPCLKCYWKACCFPVIAWLLMTRSGHDQTLFFFILWFLLLSLRVCNKWKKCNDYEMAELKSQKQKKYAFIKKKKVW